MLINTKKSNPNNCNKIWNKPIINKLQVNKTLSGIGGNVESNGHPNGSPKTGGLAY
ncbi:hypothetical protein [Sulfurovum sp.]|uniref:hypothetical protein n=1 Tax=Sulfurovum sp. TaxID=1969726 RepID=UPI0028681EDC|nr:hypothetical protein [Sulfurovum sp.]